MRILLLAALVALPCVAAHAQADVTLQITFPDGQVLVPGEVIEVGVTMINLGPDPAEGVAAGTGWPATVGHRTFTVLATPQTAPCDLAYTDIVVPPPGISQEAVTIFPTAAGGGTLGAGAQVTCVVGIGVFPESPARMSAFFSVGTTTPESNDTNNTLEAIVVNGNANAVAVPSNGPRGMWVLALLLVLVGASKIKGRDRSAGTD